MRWSLVWKVFFQTARKHKIWISILSNFNQFQIPQMLESTIIRILIAIVLESTIITILIAIVWPEVPIFQETDMIFIKFQKTKVIGENLPLSFFEQSRTTCLIA